MAPLEGLWILIVKLELLLANSQCTLKPIPCSVHPPIGGQGDDMVVSSGNIIEGATTSINACSLWYKRQGNAIFRGPVVEICEMWRIQVFLRRFLQAEDIECALASDYGTHPHAKCNRLDRWYIDSCWY